MVKSTIFQNFPNSPYILMIFTYGNHCQAKKPEKVDKHGGKLDI
jgi:hypothetical protein